jgi:AbiV family abortive infection protein
MSQSLSNAKRLLRDAVLLNNHARHASAFALAVLGLEEIGKVILKGWELPDSEGRLHRSKQMAVSSLLLMDDAVRKIQQEVAGPSEFTPDVQERIARAVVDGEAGHFSGLVTIKMVDAMKLFALYYDGEFEGAGFDPDQFTREDVVSIFKTCWSALNTIDDDKTMRLAKDHFLAKRERAKPRSCA